MLDAPIEPLAKIVGYGAHAQDLVEAYGEPMARLLGQDLGRLAVPPRFPQGQRQVAAALLPLAGIIVQAAQPETDASQPDSIAALTFTADGQQLLTANYDAKTLSRWSIQDGVPGDPVVVASQTDNPLWISLSPAGDEIAAEGLLGAEDGRLKLSRAAAEAHLRLCFEDDGFGEAGRHVLLAMDEAGYRPPRPLDSIRVLGEPGLSAIQVGLYNFAAGGYITEYDQVVGGKLAWVLCGGEVSASSRVSEVA